MDKTAYFEQMRSKRRTEILNAAREMILAHGMTDFNIQQLARDLDISTVTLYKYFKNSEDIMSAMKEQIVQNIINNANFHISTESDQHGLDLVMQLLEQFYKEALNHRNDVTLLLLFKVYMHGNETSDMPDDLSSTLIKDFTIKLKELLIKAVEDGSTRPELDIDGAAQFISRMNLSMLHYIGLLGSEDYIREEQAVKKQIGQLIHMFALYLTS